MKTLDSQTGVVDQERVPVSARLVVASSKVHPRHLERLAVVYVRQSSARQVHENTESTQLQYRLVDRAAALGWAGPRVLVIDEDLGVSGSSIEGRVGFQRLLAEVSLDHVGIVLGIEMSRLARSCRDWHQLLELCALFGTLLGDADGVYDPRDFNDRLLLGLKGTMSEAELHMLHGRLDAGKRNKARRGELFNHPPIGYVRTREGVVLEPDEQARGVVRLVFDKFAELGSVAAVMRYMRTEQIQIGVRDHRGADRGELQWRQPNRVSLLGLLHHPIYAGAYVYGRRETDPRRRVPGKPGSGRRWAKRDAWQVLIHDALPAYITWEQWEKNQEKLRQNSSHYGSGAPRGVALLAGRVVCGKCGRRMSICYAGRSKARFTCDAARNQWGEPQCQSFKAQPLDTLVTKQLLIALEPASLELSLHAAESIEEDRRRAEDHHRQTLERATYQASVARRRLTAVEPENRLVAAELEREWEAALQCQRHAKEELDRFRLTRPTQLTTEQRERIVALSQDIHALWRAEGTTGVDRQIILRALVERIVVEVLAGTDRATVTIHWKGGFESRHQFRRAVSSFAQLEDAPGITNQIVQLRAKRFSFTAIAGQLNAEGYHSTTGRAFTSTSVRQLRRVLRRQGRIPNGEELAKDCWRQNALAARLGLKTSTLNTWRRRGWVQAEPAGNRWVYWADAEDLARLDELVAHARKKLMTTPQRLTTPRFTIPRN